MSQLSDFIVSLWLLPVVLQIILPLLILVIWLIGKPIYQISAKQKEASPVTGFTNEATP